MEKTFVRIKIVINNSQKQIKHIMSILQITYLFTLKKTLLVYLVGNQL